MKDTKYTYITLCRDPYEDKAAHKTKIGENYVSDNDLALFDTKDDAFNAAYETADKETEELNDGADKGISFNIPEDKNFETKDEIKVMYYYNDNDGNLINETWVTKRIIKKIEIAQKQT